MNGFSTPLSGQSEEVTFAEQGNEESGTYSGFWQGRYYPGCSWPPGTSGVGDH